jgi:hypothetical protein
MVEERQPDVSSSPVVHRCINCGLILDPLMMQNRLSHLKEKRVLVHAA